MCVVFVGLQCIFLLRYCGVSLSHIGLIIIAAIGEVNQHCVQIFRESVLLVRYFTFSRGVPMGICGQVKNNNALVGVMYIERVDKLDVVLYWRPEAAKFFLLVVTV